MKKITAVILSVLFLSLLSLPLFAGEIFVDGDYNYTVEENGVYITIYFGEDEDVVVPDTIDDLPVVGIRSTAFYSSGIKTVTLPTTVTDIEEEAFLPTITVYQNTEVIVEAEETLPETQAVTTAETEATAESDTEAVEAVEEDISNGEDVTAGEDIAIRADGEEETAEVTPEKDNSVLILAIALVAVCAAAVIVIVITLKKSKENKGE